MRSKHSPNPTDFKAALCGTSREGSEGGPMLAVTMAEPGEQITCGRCRAIIALIKHHIGPRNVLKRSWRKVVQGDA